MPRLEYDVVFNLDQGSAQTLEQSLNDIGSGGSAKSVQRTKNEVSDLNVQLDRTSTSADEAKQALKGISSGSTGLKRMSNNVRGAANETRNLSKVANNSNQILFSFGDAVQDSAQFSQGFASGARAVGNNLTFAAEQISIASQQAGSFTGALKSIGSSMLGPAGIVFAVNAAVTAITLWSQSTEKAKKETKDLTQSFSSFAEEVAGIGQAPVFDPLGALTQQRELEQLQALERELSSLFRFRNTAKDLRKGLINLRDEMDKSAISGAGLATQFQRVDKGSGKLSKEVRRVSGLLTDVNSIIGKQEKFFGELSKAEEQALQKKIEDAKATAALNEAYIKLNPALRLQKNISEELTPALRRLELGLSGGEQAVRQLSDEYQRQINSLRSSNNLTEEQVRRLSILTEAHKQTTEALKDENKQLEHNLDIRFRIRRQQAAMRQLGVNQLEVPRAAGGAIREDAITQEQNRLAKFLNIKKSVAQKRFDIEKQLQNKIITLHKNTEQAQTAITEAESEARKNRALTAIQAVGTGLTQVFEKQKGVAVAGAIINAGAAIVRQFKDLPIWAAIPSAALVAAKTAKQIQQITSVEEGDENAPSVGGGRGSGLSGFNTSTLDRNNQPNPRVAQDSSINSPQISIELRTEADNKIISKKAMNGRKQRIDNAVRVQ